MNQVKLILLLGIFLSSCNTENSKGQISLLQSKGLEEDNLNFKTMIIPSDSIGFIAGSQDIIKSNERKGSDTFAFIERKAVLFSTKDQGRSWERHDFGEGVVLKIKEIDGALFFIKVSETDSHTDIYRSDNLGANWVLIRSFPRFVSDVFFYKSKIYVLGKDDSNTYKLYFASDGNDEWMKMDLTEFPILGCELIDNKLICLIDSGVNASFKGKNILIQYDLIGGSKRDIGLPSGFNCYSISGQNNDVNMIGTHRDSLMVYSYGVATEDLKWKYSVKIPDKFDLKYFKSGANEDWALLKREQRTQILKMNYEAADENGR